MITFAGVELGYEDPDGVATGWIEKFLPLVDLRDQTAPAATRSQRPASRSGYRPGTSVPILNYPEPPRVKLSTLYWPTGACRWARGYFLAAGQDVAKILTIVGENEPADMLLKDQDNQQSVTARMYLLPPRLLTAAEGGDDALWLLPLVDQRYYWQFKATGEIRYTLESTWADVFDDLQAGLGVTIAVDTVSLLYGIPDPDELSRPYENAAVLLDAAAFSVGQTVVCDLDGTVRSMGWATSAVRRFSNTAQLELLAGGDFSAANPAATMPNSVIVSFTKWREGAVDPTGDLWVETIPASAGAVTSGTEKVIHSAAFADFTTKGGAPDNASEVHDLASIIAGDYYASLSARYDYVLPSLATWLPSGFDDFLEFSFGRLHKSGEWRVASGEWQAGDGQPEYLAHTRIHSRPYNFGAEEQLQQFQDKPVYPALTRFKLTSNLAPLASPSDQGNSAPATHQKWDTTQTKYTDSSDQLTVYDVDNAFPGISGQYGWAEYKADSLRWEIVSLDNRFAHASLLQDLSAGGTSTAAIYQLQGGGEVASGLVVPVRDWNAGPLKLSQGQGDVFVRWEPQSSAWYVIGAAKNSTADVHVLGVVEADTPNNSVATVNVYGAPQGAEVAIGQTIEAWNKLYGTIVDGTFVWCAQNEAGWYIVATQRGNGYLAQVPQGTAIFPAGDTPIDTTIAVNLYYGPTGSSIAVTTSQARIKFAPLADTEWCWVEWNGDVFVIVRAEYDGGVSGVTAAAIPAQGSGKVTLNGSSPRVVTAQSPLGAVANGKRVWLNRNRNGWFIVSAEC